MLDIISMWITNRDELNARSMFAFVVFFAMAFVWRVYLKPSVERWGWVARGLPIFFRFVCLSVLAASIGQALLYASHPVFFDTYEASVASVGGLVGQGVPLYHHLGDPARYVQMGYGPMLYLIDYAVARAFGLTMEAAKMASIASFIGSLLLMARAFKRPTSRFSLLCPQGLAAAAGLALSLDYFQHQAFWTRGDPIIVFLVVASVWAIEERRVGARGAAVAIGLALGVAVNVKVSAVVYFVPLAVVAWPKLGARYTALGLVVAVGSAAAPFFLATVSLRAYLEWLGLMKRQGYGDWDGRYWHAKRALFWSTPLVVAWLFASIARVRRKRAFVPSEAGGKSTRLFVSMVLSFRRIGRLQHAYFVATLVTFGALIVIASKPGSTEHHYLPFFPVVIHAIHRMAPRDARGIDMRTIVGLAMGTVLFFTDFTPGRLLAKRQTIVRQTSREMAAEVQRFIDDHPGKTMEMGAGASLPPTYFRVLFVYAKMPYRIDVGTLMDLQSVGEFSVPEALHERLRSCATDYFFVQSSSSPFRVKGVYTSEPAYEESYREDFVNTYVRTAQLRYFDVWTCRNPPDGG